MKSGEAVQGESPAVVLVNPKHRSNVAACLRACSAFGVKQLWLTGKRFELEPDERIPREERMELYRHVEVLRHEKPLERFPRDVKPICVELVRGSQLLPFYSHPPNAVYVLGPEDGDVPQSIARECHEFVQIPVPHCLNLSAALHIVLYDRSLKVQ